MIKECFGKVIKDSGKMEECKRCELLQECIAINWKNAEQGESAPQDDNESERDQSHSSGTESR